MMAALSVERRLAAILSADVVGYSRLMGEDEEGTLRSLHACREVVDRLVADHHGRVFGSAGDSVMAEFPSAVDAVRCASLIQSAIAARDADLPEGRRMRFRIGVHLGDVMIDGANLMGDGVNVAARLEALADPGGIMISGAAFDQVEGKLGQDFAFVGERRVKNIARPVRVYRVRTEPPRRGDAARRVLRHPGATQLARAALAVGLALALGLIAWFLYLQPLLRERAFEREAALPLPDRPSVAILPFAGLGAGPDQEYFSDGITDDLITSLSQLSGLFVIARNSAFAYKGRPVDVRQVGRELGVRYVVEGSVQRADDRVRINAQLVDAATGFHLWAERFERELGDIFALQDEVTADIVAALEVELSEAEERRIARRYTSSFDAYDAFLQGWEQLYRGTVEANLRARDHFERAIRLDPGFARAYANLALTYTAVPTGLPPPDASLERAQELARTAVTLDDTLPQVHWVLAAVHLYRREYEEALAASKRAVAIDPNFADAHVQQGFILVFSGRSEEGLPLIEYGMRLNPRYPAGYLMELGRAQFALGRYDEAIATLEGAVERNPNLWEARLFLAASYASAGRTGDAEWEIAELLTGNPGFSVQRVDAYAPYKNPADLRQLTDALRRAGLPE